MLAGVISELSFWNGNLAGDNSMPIVIFRSRLRPEATDEYRQLAPRMLELARQVPGFVSFKSFDAGDGERVGIAEFDSEEGLKAWREHPEHRQAQRAGRDRLYSEYKIQVCEPVRESSFNGEPLDN